MIIRIAIVLLAISCGKDRSAPDIISENMEQSPDSTAQVLDVIVTGSEGNYTFNTQLKSPDTGCEQYADWWEVIDESGRLIYRRNLGHSHVNEQPFYRSGGPVKVDATAALYIRGHMNTNGYGSVVFKGSVKSGFLQDTLNSNFAKELETTAPLPPKCAF